jgi:hypothetical protein
MTDNLLLMCPTLSAGQGGSHFGLGIFLAHSLALVLTALSLSLSPIPLFSCSRIRVELTTDNSRLPLCYHRPMALPLRDVVRCPECNSRDVVYSCEPKCCFNHVCADCKTTFQITTSKLGRSDPTAGEVARPESGDPTTNCCVCHSLRVGVVSDNDAKTLICGDCKALLSLQYEDIVSGRVVS